MAWSFSGLFRQRTVKETFDPTPIAVGIVPPSLTDTLWALRRTEDMVELILSFSGGKLVSKIDGWALVPDGALTLTAWFRPQHGQERAAHEPGVFTGKMSGMLSGWSRVVVKRPAGAAAELAFTAPELLKALEDWPLVLTKNAAPADGETGDFLNIGLAHGVSLDAAARAVEQLKSAGAKIGRKVGPSTGAGVLDARGRTTVQAAADKAVSKVVTHLGVTNPVLVDAAHRTFNEGVVGYLGVVELLTPPGKPVKPPLAATALELPYRLYLSPTRKERFRHRTTPFAAAGRTELWSSRLTLKESAEPGGAEEASRDPAAVRPIWTPDLVDPPVPGSKAAAADADFAMSGLDRSDLVHLGADYGAPISGLSTTWKPTPARVRRLELSALGGFLDLHGHWLEPLPAGISLVDWKHRLSLGRDSRVEITRAGVLAPFGHKAVFITVTTREIRDIPHALTPGDQAWFADVALLVKRTYIAVTEPKKRFDATTLPNGGRTLPFTEVEILTGVTQTNGWFAGDWPQMVGLDAPVSFAVKARDGAGRTVRFTMPMAFVQMDAAVATTPCQAFRNSYNAGPATKDPNLTRAALGRQVVQLAPDPAKDSLSLPVSLFDFEIEEFKAASEANGGRHLFRPKLKMAKVEAPGAGEFAGGAKDVEVAYFNAYASGGYGGANAGEVALALTTPLPLFAPGGGASSEKAGPIATPRVAIHGYSRLTGAVTGDASAAAGAAAKALDAVAGGGLDPATLLPDMKLLGAFPISDLLGALKLPSADGEATLGEAMRLKREKTPEGERAVLTFSQSLKKEIGAGLVFSPASGAELNLRAIAAVPSAGAASGTPAAQSLDAAVTHFGISFFGVIRIDFKKLAFVIRPGAKPDLDLVFADPKPAGPGPLTFTGDLAFLQQLADILPTSAFSDPPDLQITTSGVVAGYSLGLPPIQLGALALSNIGFGARFQLPFLGDAPSLRVNFAERHSPFGILVSLLGGGGFFAVELDTHGLKMIEGTLEAQAGIAINLGVAAGAVQARLGIYYRWEVSTAGDKMTFEAFAELRGELCVLGLITVSITFHVALGLVKSDAGKELVGKASITVEIELLFFSKSVSVECERRFQGSKGDPTFLEVFPAATQPSAWTAYTSAFA